MNKYLISVVCLSALLGGAAVRAQTEDGGLAVQAEHSRIQAEREKIEKRFADEEVACFKKFAVTDCLNASRARRRVDLADLRRQEILLNDAERKRRGAEQLQRMEKSAEQDTPPVEGAVREKPTAQVRTHPPVAPRQPHDPAQAEKAQAERKATLDKKRAANEQEQVSRSRKAATAEAERARYANKLKDAQEHEAQTRRRNEENTKTRSAPLPVPVP